MQEQLEPLSVPISKSHSVSKWLPSVRAVLPVYLATHLTFFLLTAVSPLFSLDNFSTTSLPLNSLGHEWNRWDTGNFLAIATHGYSPIARTAFFPLYPLLIRTLMVLIPSPLLAALLISNVTGFLMLVVVHRLVEEDEGSNVAQRTILLLSIFPTAFFFAAAYNESLFLLLVLLSFYQMRHDRFWLAAVFGLFASLTRSAGLLLLIPFVYEYWRRGRISFDALAILAIPLGTGLFALYCQVQFGDALAFSHAQATWDRHLAWPWTGILASLQIIQAKPLLSFDSLHNLIDLSSGLFVSLFVLLSFAGPYKFKPAHRSYVLFGLVLLLFPLLVPSADRWPLQSLSRLVLEIFPAFVVMARISVKHRTFEPFYVMVSVSLTAFLLLQFLTGRWVV